MGGIHCLDGSGFLISLTVEEGPETRVISFDLKKHGLCVFPIASCLNHSCISIPVKWQSPATIHAHFPMYNVLYISKKINGTVFPFVFFHFANQQ